MRSILFFFIIFFLYSCESDSGSNGSTANEIISLWSTEKPLESTFSFVNAGADWTLNLPRTNTFLEARVDSQFESINWSQIGGSTAIIISPHSLKTKVTGLGLGRNIFRFSAMINGVEHSDDVVIIVRPALDEYVNHPEAGKVSRWNSIYESAVFLPVDYGTNPNKLYPLILSLNGYGENVFETKSGFIKQVWDTELAHIYPAIVIAPDSRSSSKVNFWSHQDLRKLIVAALSEFKIDKKRIVIAGHSEGSLAGQLMLLYSKDLIAAAMLGGYSSDALKDEYCLVADIPVWTFGNSSDAIYKSNSWQLLEEKFSKCSNYTYEFSLNTYINSCGHDCFDEHWKKIEVQDWLVNQQK